MYNIKAVVKKSQDAPFEVIQLQRGSIGDYDVDMDIKYCGICHTDVHVANNDFRSTKYPCVPGHELAGIVTKVGKSVTDLKVGDHVGIGYMIDSCLKCSSCNDFDEHTCIGGGNTGTSNGDIQHGHIKTDNGKYTYGGFTDKITVHRRFAVKIPQSYPLEKAGPIFCAGITMFSPLMRQGAGKGGLNVGIIGIGGLGQMGVRLAAAMGNKVTAISTSGRKEAMAKEMGACDFVVSSDPASMSAAAGSLNLILNTVSANHQMATYFPLLKRGGTIVQLGAVAEPHLINQIVLMRSRINLTGSMIGGMKETQECMDYFAQNNIVCNTQLVQSCKELDKVFETLSKGNDGVVRYVADIDKLIKD